MYDRFAMSRPVDLLVKKWGKLQATYMADARYFRDEHGPALMPLLIQAQAKLDACGVQIAAALRDLSFESKSHREHAADLRRVRQSLAEARYVVTQAHEMIALAREARRRGQEMSGDDLYRRQRILDRNKPG
jgi:hypothetical protein